MTPSMSGHRPTLRAGWIHRLLVVGLVIILLMALKAPGAGITANAEEAPSLYTVRERFGVNIAFSLPGEPSFPGRLSDYPRATELGFGWYSDWRVDIDPPRPGGIEYAQLIQTRRWPPNWGHIENVAQANPGALWMVGNEPETRGQGQHTPEEYAAIYHDAYTTLKQIDPTAQVAIGGVVMPTPLRLKWLEQCLDYYEATYGQPMPVDVWNIHVQILQEKRDGWGCGIPFGLTEDAGRLYEIQDNHSVPIFEQLVWDFRQWLYERGEGHKELIISEYGVLMPSSYLPNGDEDVRAFMEGTFDFMLHTRDATLGCPADGGRLVQRWMWFSLNFPSHDETQEGFNGALMDWRQPDEFTALGLFFRDYVTRLAEGGVLLSAVADTYSDGLRPSQRPGRLGRLKVRGGRNPASALVLFDLDALPSGAVVTHAELRLQIVASSNPQSLVVGVRPVTIPWTETSASVDMRARWPLADPVAQLRLTPPEPGQSVVVTGDITTLVRAWHEGSTENLGLRIGAEGLPPSSNATYDLASREWIEGHQPGPELWVEYVFARAAVPAGGVIAQE